jgi:two-component system, sensor histidine kinase
VTLPLAPVTTVSEPASTLRAGEAVAAQRILVVDDNADACEMLRLALGQAGHELAVAANGPDALAIAPGFRPSVGVLDIGLPGMDGCTTLRAAFARRIRGSD